MSDSLKVVSTDVRPSSATILRSENANVSYKGICTIGSNRLLGQSSGLQLLIYPQPASSDFSVEVIANEKGMHSLLMFDINGSTVRKYDWPGIPGSAYILSLKGHEVPEGFYSFVVISPTQIKTAPAIVTR
jgi:hypothetical protein